MKDLILLWQADSDIQSAYNRYENFQDGRGAVLLNHLEVALSIIRRHPLIARTYAGPFRRMLVRNFPLGIFYEVQPTRVMVVRVMDLRQDPRIIRRRLLED